MKVAEIEVKITLARREMEWWQNILGKKRCGDCNHFDGYGCKLANGQVPPPEVQKTGCPEWDWDGIPF